MNIKTLVVSGVICVILDSIYLSLILPLFQKQMIGIQGTGSKLNIVAAVLCYLFIIFGLNYFILSARPQRSWKDAFLLGLMVCGIYELTNKALISKWYWSIVGIDTLWGGVLFALTTILTRQALK